jgi:DNA-binding response OmpR family regulator
MATLPHLLLVEDNPVNALIVIRGLADQYDIEHVETAEACQEAIASKVPDIVLLDVVLPGSDGYSICRQLRADSATHHLPVIFVSAKDAMEDRLAGYDAGGNDFLVKPISIAELKQKAALAMRFAENNRHLRSDVDSAFRTAMSAMSSAAELGVVLHFFRESFTAASVAHLAKHVIETMGRLDLDASVQLRGRYGTCSMNAEGFCSPLEDSILSNVRDSGRIFDMGRRTAINYERVTLVAKNMPKDNADQYGRLRDSLTLLAEGIDARMQALDNEEHVLRRNKVLQELTQTAESVRDNLDSHLRQLSVLYSTQIRKVVGEVSDSMVFLGLSAYQSEGLNKILDTTQSQIEEVEDLLVEIKGDMTKLMQGIRKTAD